MQSYLYERRPCKLVIIATKFCYVHKATRKVSELGATSFTEVALRQVTAEVTVSFALLIDKQSNVAFPVELPSLTLAFSLEISLLAAGLTPEVLLRHLKRPPIPLRLSKSTIGTFQNRFQAYITSLQGHTFCRKFGNCLTRYRITLLVSFNG